MKPPTTAITVSCEGMLEDANLLGLFLKDKSIPGELVYDVTGFVGVTAEKLAEAFKHLADGFVLAIAEYDVHDDNRHPAATVEIAHAGLADAVLHATNLAAALGRVQAAVTGMTCTERRTEAAPVEYVAGVRITTCEHCKVRLATTNGQGWYAVTGDAHPALLAWTCYGQGSDGKHVPSSETTGEPA